MLNVVDSLPVPERGADYGARCGSGSSGAFPARRAVVVAAGAVAVGGGRRGVGVAAGDRRSWRAASIRRRARPAQTGERRSARRRADPAGRGRRLPGTVPDGADRAGQRQSERSARYFRRAGARRRPGQRKPPVPADRGAHGRHGGRRACWTISTACCWKSRTRPRGCRPTICENCANGWKPKAFCSRSAFWAPTSGTRKNPPRTLRRPPGAKNSKRLNMTLSRTIPMILLLAGVAAAQTSAPPPAPAAPGAARGAGYACSAAYGARDRRRSGRSAEAGACSAGTASGIARGSRRKRRSTGAARAPFVAIVGDEFDAPQPPTACPVSACACGAGPSTHAAGAAAGRAGRRLPIPMPPMPPQASSSTRTSSSSCRTSCSNCATSSTTTSTSSSIPTWTSRWRMAGQAAWRS